MAVYAEVFLARRYLGDRHSNQQRGLHTIDAAMRFGAFTLPRIPWDELVEQWRYREELRFDSVYVADALAHPRDASER